jgi:hypothetical protein
VGAGGVARKGSFTAGRHACSTFEFAETFHKTPALVSHAVRCGKPNCRCATGEGHGPYWFLRWREGPYQRRRYVKQADLAAVRAVVERRQAADRADRLARMLALEGLREVEAWLRTLRTG